MTNPEIKELLELAAKACGYRYVEPLYNKESTEVISHEIRLLDDSFTVWNPLTNDGDYSRMEAQLGLEATWLETHVEVDVNCSSNFTWEFYADHNGDKQAARRAAGTRLAAEIGRAMK